MHNLSKYNKLSHPLCTAKLVLDPPTPRPRPQPVLDLRTLTVAVDGVEMEALRVYDSDSCDEDCDTERSLQTSVSKRSSDEVPEGTETHVENSTLKRKHITGYVPRRKSARLVSIPKESLNILTTFSSDISLYLTSPVPKLRQHKEGQRVLPGRAPYATFNQHTKPVVGLDWHPTDDRLLLSCSLDGTVRLWDAVWQHLCIATYTMQDVPMKRVAWITNTTIVTAGYDNDAFHTDIESGRILSRMKHNSYVTALAAHPKDPNSLLTGNSKSEIHRWDLRCCKDVNSYKGAAGQILDILFLKSGDEFVASSDIERRSGYSQAMNVWDCTSGVVLATQVYFEPYTCPFLRLHPTEPVFLAQSNANYLTVFSAQKPYKMNKSKRFEGHTLDGYNVGFDVSNDGSIVCSASANGTVIFYDYSSTRILKSLQLGTSSTLNVEWHPRLLSTVAVSSWNGHIYCLK